MRVVAYPRLPSPLYQLVWLAHQLVGQKPRVEGGEGVHICACGYGRGVGVLVWGVMCVGIFVGGYVCGYLCGYCVGIVWVIVWVIV